MWELDYKESWALKNWCFWSVVLEKTLESPWTARRSNQSILKEISPEYLLEGLMLKWNSNTLATWCEELTHLKRPWCWERLRAGGEGEDRGWDGWMASPTQWTWVSKLLELVMHRETWHAAVYGFTESQTRLSDWTDRSLGFYSFFFFFPICILFIIQIIWILLIYPKIQWFLPLVIPILWIMFYCNFYVCNFHLILFYNFCFFDKIFSPLFEENL